MIDISTPAGFSLVRQACGYSQKTAEEAMGIGRGTLGIWENPKRPTPPDYAQEWLWGEFEKLVEGSRSAVADAGPEKGATLYIGRKREETPLTAEARAFIVQDPRILDADFQVKVRFIMADGQKKP